MIDHHFPFFVCVMMGVKIDRISINMTRKLMALREKCSSAYTLSFVRKAKVFPWLIFSTRSAQNNNQHRDSSFFASPRALNLCPFWAPLISLSLVVWEQFWLLLGSIQFEEQNEGATGSQRLSKGGKFKLEMASNMIFPLSRCSQ